MTANLLEGVLKAQTRNSLLSGQELSRAARGLLRLLRAGHFTVLASDAVGERVLGAALCVEPGIGLADRSRRLDGCDVLLVAGHISGDAWVVESARSARSLGASSVRIALLTRWEAPIEGCDDVWFLGTDYPVRALASA